MIAASRRIATEPITIAATRSLPLIRAIRLLGTSEIANLALIHSAEPEFGIDEDTFANY
jgi:hypothetical protein